MKNQRTPEEFSYRYVIGIDLGTTNSAVAYVDLMQEPDASSHRPIQFFEIPQLVAQAEMARGLLNAEKLFLDDIEGLTAEQEEALRSRSANH